jgi:hypothetical protein
MPPLLMLMLPEGGRIPVDDPTGHFELESKSFEYSGRGFALMKWGGQLKMFVHYPHSLPLSGGCDPSASPIGEVFVGCLRSSGGGSLWKKA